MPTKNDSRKWKMETKADDVITLEIQDSSVQCSRNVLIENSDYFRAMLEGNFVESSKNTISLKDVDLEAVKIILKVLWDKEYLIAEEHILSVLQNCCMLQFLQVKQICCEQIKGMLSLQNCLPIWLCTECLSIKDIFCKAKLMALLEFMHIKDTTCFTQLELQGIVHYLGNRNLQALSEFAVFEGLLKWYKLQTKNCEILIKLLHCVNFNDLTSDEICDIIALNEIDSYKKVKNALKCLLALRESEDLNFSEEEINLANSLIKAKSRNKRGIPCIFVGYPTPAKQPEVEEVYYYDMYGRPRKYRVVEESKHFICCLVDLKKLNYFHIWENADPSTKKTQKWFQFEVTNLHGFKFEGYKNQIVVCGGEFSIGHGKWNTSFEMYDTIREEWQRRRFPFCRRHFESCVSGNYLFIVGGTGPFRVIQENIFFYNFERRVWSKEIQIPCSERKLRCCSFQNQLFLLCLNNRCAYLFQPENKTWNRLEMCTDIFNHYTENIIVFPHRRYLYVKDVKFYELAIENGKLSCTREMPLPEQLDKEHIKLNCRMPTVFCNDFIYSISKAYPECKTASIELFHLENPQTYQSLDDEFFPFDLQTQIFSAFNPEFVAANDLINTL